MQLGIRSEVDIPLEAHQTTARFYTFHGLIEPAEHVALGFLDARSQAAPLVRLHSECLTGDVFSSMRCDCGAQLDEAIATMTKQGGIILYLRQEGRGIGLYNKLDAYRLQDEGMDTYEANQALGFETDMRNYKAAAQMLQALGVNRCQLLTNNPDKIQQLSQYGIEVIQQVPTQTFCNVHNHGYLSAKQSKTQHSLTMDKVPPSKTPPKKS